MKNYYIYETLMDEIDLLRKCNERLQEDVNFWIEKYQNAMERPWKALETSNELIDENEKLKENVRFLEDARAALIKEACEHRAELTRLRDLADENTETIIKLREELEKANGVCELYRQDEIDLKTRIVELETENETAQEEIKKLKPCEKCVHYGIHPTLPTTYICDCKYICYGKAHWEEKKIDKN